MTKQNFEKEKIQVWYDAHFTFTIDNTVTDAAKKIIAQVQNQDEWTFIGTGKKDGISKIERYLGPKKFDGHQESEGWSWQTDASTMGKGSVARLVLACKPNNITISSTKEDGTVKVGTDEYKKYVVKLAVTGQFRFLPNSKK